MAQLVVRNLEENIKLRLQRRAALHGRSMEEEVRDILRDAVKNEDGRIDKLGSSIARHFRGLGLNEDIPEHRNSPARPANFEE